MKSVHRFRLLAAIGLEFAAFALVMDFDVALVAVPAHAEVQKVLFVCVHGRKKEICPQFRPSLRAPEGWVEDRTAEAKLGRIIYVPRGKTYETAPAAITAVTTSNKQKTSIETLVQRDQEAFKQTNKDATILPLAGVTNEKLGGLVKFYKVVAPDAKPRTFMIRAIFADKDEEGALFTVDVTLSDLTERGLAEMRPKLEAMVKGY